MSYRFETKYQQARRRVRQDFAAHIGVGLFLCLTIIGSPIGVIMIILAFVERSKSMNAITQGEHHELARAQQRHDDAWLRAVRRMP